MVPREREVRGPGRAFPKVRLRGRAAGRGGPGHELVHAPGGLMPARRGRVGYGSGLGYSIQVRIDVLTLFPEVFAGPLQASILGRALTSGLASVELHDIRGYAHDRHHVVDD